MCQRMAEVSGFAEERVRRLGIEDGFCMESVNLTTGNYVLSSPVVTINQLATKVVVSSWRLQKGDSY